MAKIAKKAARIFGGSAGFQQISEFGSLAAASIVYSTDPDIIQSLSAWLSGWFAAVVGSNSPAIQDMNAFCYVMAYQIAYLMQAGIPEWDAATIYYNGSLVQDTGRVFVSIQDNSSNHATTDAARWQVIDGAVKSLTFTDTGYTLSGTNKWEKTALVNTAGGNTVVNLPQASTCAGLILGVAKTSSDANIVTVTAFSGDTINGLTTQTIENQYTILNFLSTGTGWIVT